MVFWHFLEWTCPQWCCVSARRPSRFQWDMLQSEMPLFGCFHCKACGMDGCVRGVRSEQWRGRSPTHRWWCSRRLHSKTVLGLILTESSVCRVIKVHVQTCRGLCFTCTILSCFPSVFQWKHKKKEKVEKKRMRWILTLKYFIIQSV